MCGSFFFAWTLLSQSILQSREIFCTNPKLAGLRMTLFADFPFKNFRGPGARLLPIDLMVSIEHRVKLKPGRRVLLVSVDGRLVRSCCSPARSSLEASLLPVGQHDPKRPHRSRAENFFENLLHRLLRSTCWIPHCRNNEKCEEDLMEASWLSWLVRGSLKEILLKAVFKETSLKAVFKVFNCSSSTVQGIEKWPKMQDWPVPV